MQPLCTDAAFIAGRASLQAFSTGRVARPFLGGRTPHRKPRHNHRCRRPQHRRRSRPPELHGQPGHSQRHSWLIPLRAQRRPEREPWWRFARADASDAALSRAHRSARPATYAPSVSRHRSATSSSSRWRTRSAHASANASFSASKWALGSYGCRAEETESFMDWIRFSDRQLSAHLQRLPAGAGVPLARSWCRGAGPGFHGELTGCGTEQASAFPSDSARWAVADAAAAHQRHRARS